MRKWLKQPEKIFAGRKKIRGSVCRLRDEDGSPVESMEGPDGRVW